MRSSITKGELRMIRRTVNILFAAIVLMGFAIPAKAAEEGSIRITLDVGELAVTNGAVTLYQVGLRSPDGYRLLEEFGGGMVKETDALSPHLAKWLAQTAEGEGTSRLLDVDGCVEFSRLEDGLYLVVQTEDMDGFYRIEPFLVTLPCEGARNVQANPKTRPIMATEPPPTGQHPAPILGAMGLVISGVGLFLCLGRKKRK